jgi:ABC-type lipoprotein release transport system permease subunit
MFFQLGWRNIWRNRRRTLVILTAVIIGVWSMIFLGALMRGIADQFVSNSIKTLTGHIQVHHLGYRDDPVVENSMTDPSEIEATLTKVLPDGSRWAPRVRVNAVVSNARHSTGVTMVGIDPPREAAISFIGGTISEGRYLNSDDPYGIVVGQALVDKFGTRLGYKLVLMSQDTEGEIASRAFRIIGIYRAEMEATEKQFVFVTISAAQQMLKLHNGISEIAILLPVHGEATQVARALRAKLPANKYEVLTWQELQPMVTAILKMYDFFIYIWFLVVFIAMGFGIVNTTLMAVFERIREFGLFKALGMKPRWIIQEVIIESFFILIYPAILGQDVIMANLVVFFLGLVVSLYPAVKAARFTPVEALAHT